MTLHEEIATLRAALREMGRLLEAAHGQGVGDERAAVVAWLRACANAPHPIERGVPWLSPAGRGLLLRHADAIECGEHLIDNMHAHSEGLAEGERREHRREEEP